MTRSPPASPEPAGRPPAALTDVPTDMDETLDVRGMMCPLPVLKARKALKRLAPGAVLRVLATDPAAVIDFKHFCETTRFELQGWQEDAGTYAFRIGVPG